MPKRCGVLGTVEKIKVDGKRYSATKVPVLIHAEAGAEKEEIARTLCQIGNEKQTSKNSFLLLISSSFSSLLFGFCLIIISPLLGKSGNSSNQKVATSRVG